MNWIDVHEKLPIVNGPPVIGIINIKGTQTAIGSLRFTTERGDCYKGTPNEGEPVWELWQPYAEECTVVIGPHDVTHWMPLPKQPSVKEE